MSVPRQPFFNGGPSYRPRRIAPNGEARRGGSIDWPRWLRLVERKRRLTGRSGTGHASHLPDAMLALGTLASFRLEGIDVDDSTTVSALKPGALKLGRDYNPFRSRLAMRIRNHVAILHRIERGLHHGESLKTAAVVRWYTLISSGLSITSLDEPTMNRLDQLVRRINSPHLRLQPAVQEIARLHAQALADPLVPGFNGILARLLLRYHLGRCGLPPVVFHAETDGPVMTDETSLLARLLELIDESYDLLLSEMPPPAPAGV
jgi:hypothetical protein